MTSYVVGDIQGCYDPLMRLLETIQFDPTQDVLWSTGDLVNRGPQSLEVLRFFKSLGDRQRTVLGNHDLHLLALAFGAKKHGKKDNLDAIFTAPDGDDLLEWLRHRPIFIHDEKENYALAHAGLAPMWALAEAKDYAREVEAVLRGSTPDVFLSQMYGNQPDLWSDTLTGIDRLRCIVNYFTRMRFCYADGSLNLEYKGGLDGKPEDVMPWFKLMPRANADVRILFGHWAALGGIVDVPNVFALDTGCVWGNCLTAMRLSDGVRFQVGCV